MDDVYCPICGAKVRNLPAYVNRYTHAVTQAWECPADATHYYQWRSSIRTVSSPPGEINPTLLRLANTYSDSGASDRRVSRSCFGHVPRAKRPVRVAVDSNDRRQWVGQLSLLTAWYPDAGGSRK